MTLFEQTELPDVTTGDVDPPSEVTKPLETSSHMADQMDLLRRLVVAGWEDHPLLADFNREFEAGPDGDCAARAYQVAREIIGRGRIDEEAGRLLEIALKILDHLGWGPEAGIIAGRVGGLSGTLAPLRRTAALILLKNGSAKSALFLIGEQDGVEDRLLAARCHIAIGDHEGAFKAASEAFEGLQGNGATAEVVTILVESALATSRPEAALNAIRRVPKAERPLGLLLCEANAREMTNDHKGAARALRILLERDTENATVRQRLVDTLLRSGQRDAALAVRREGLAFVHARLPSAADDLFEEPSQFGLVGPIPEDRFIWITEATGEVPDPWQAQQMLAFDHALLGWTQTRTERVRELTYRVRLSEAAQGLVMDMHLRGRGVLIAAAHVGLLHAAPLAFLAAGVRFGFTTPHDAVDLPVFSDQLIPVAGRGRSTVIRDIIARVRAGEAVGIAIDEPASTGARSVRIFDAEIPVSDACARLCKRLDVPSVFPRLLPGEGGVINVDLRLLPTPAPGQTDEAFVDIWLAAWAAEVEELLKECPWAMRGIGGFWDAPREA